MFAGRAAQDGISPKSVCSLVGVRKHLTTNVPNGASLSGQPRLYSRLESSLIQKTAPWMYPSQNHPSHLAQKRGSAGEPACAGKCWHMLAHVYI